MKASLIKNTFLNFSLLTSTLLFFNAPIFAEDIHIPIGQQAKDAPAIDLPSTGMTKDRVKALFGTPLSETPAKGNPPISSWKYAEFEVYFENNHVIHSVRNFKPHTQ